MDWYVAPLRDSGRCLIQFSVSYSAWKTVPLGFTHLRLSVVVAAAPVRVLVSLHLNSAQHRAPSGTDSCKRFTNTWSPPVLSRFRTGGSFCSLPGLSNTPERRLWPADGLCSLSGSATCARAAAEPPSNQLPVSQDRVNLTGAIGREYNVGPLLAPLKLN